MKRSFANIMLSLILSLALVFGAVPFAFTGTAYADSYETVTVGTGEETSDWLPHRTHFSNSRTQVIYDAEEIGKDGSIVSIAYNVALPSPDYKITKMKIWMGYTDLDRYDYEIVKKSIDTYILKEPDIEPVFSGAVSLGTQAGWYTIDLDEPFYYNHNNGNLVIVTGVSAKRAEPDIQYYNTVIGNGFDQNNLTALEIDDEDNASVIDPASYNGSMPWRIRSARPNIQLVFDTSSGGEAYDCEVSFDTDGGSPVPETQVVSRGGRITKPEDPEKEGYRFTGWYKGDTRYNFDSKVNNSFTLKAGWAKVYTIRFVGWNDEELQTLVLDEGEKPEYTGDTPVRPAEDGKEYVFAGWDPVIKEADQDQTYTAVFVDKSELADKTQLEAAVSKATDARTGVRTSSDGTDVGKNFEYVPESVWQAYDDALRAAQAVIDEPFADQDTVDQAVTDIETAKAEFLSAKKSGTRNPPEIIEIVISKNSGRQQPAVGGYYEWKVTYPEGTDLTTGIVTDDDFQIQRKPSGQDWKNSKCPYVSFSPSEKKEEKNIGYLTGMAIPDNTKEGDNTNLWRFIYGGDSVDCPVITQDGYSNVDKTALEGAIADAKKAQQDVKVSADGWDVSPSELFVTPDEMQALDDAIEAAEALVASERVAQSEVDRAVTDLSAAVQTFIAAKKGGNGEDEPEGYSHDDYRLIYEEQKVALPAIPVREYADTEDEVRAEWFTDKPLAFEFYDTTSQESAGVFTTAEGIYTDEEGESHKTQMLSGVELIRGHRYIVSVNETDYMIPAYYTVTIADDGAGNSNTYTANMANYYITLSDDSMQPEDYKNEAPLKYFDVTRRIGELDDPEDGKRVNIKVPVYYTKDGTSSTIITGVEDATIKFTSPYETLYASSDSYGQVSAALVEDVNYMVQLVDDSGALALDTFPLVVKDHAENGWPKSIYNHYSCGSVQGLYLIDKKYEHTRDTTLISISGKTSVTGQNFLNTSESNTDRYFINDRQLDNSTVSGLDGWDYEVFKVEAINMFRTELSKLAAGTFEITRVIPEGKTVERVYYINKKGNLKSLKFTQDGSKVTYTMNTMSLYPNVILYKTYAASQQAAPAGQTATVNSATVDAAAVQAAIQAAGGADNVTEFVIGKGVKKISKNAFMGTGIKTLIVKSKKLTKKKVKGSLKGSSVTTVKVKVGKAKANKKYVKKYKKIFTKKNAGKKVKVKR